MIHDILGVIHHNYNPIAKERGWKTMANVPGGNDTINSVSIPCKIIGFFPAEAYGKLSKEASANTFVLEWKYWLSYFSKHLNEHYSDNMDLLNYLQEEGMQNQYVSVLMMTMPKPRYKYY